MIFVMWLLVAFELYLTIIPPHSWGLDGLMCGLVALVLYNAVVATIRSKP
jgi:hypothetical protein